MGYLGSSQTCDFSEIAGVAEFLLLSFLLPALLLLSQNLRLPLDGAALDVPAVLAHGDWDSLPQLGDHHVGYLGHLERVLPLLHSRHVSREQEELIDQTLDLSARALVVYRHLENPLFCLGVASAGQLLRI